MNKSRSLLLVRVSFLAKRLGRIVTVALVAMLASSGAAAAAFDSWQVSVDYDKLSAALGPAVPGGAGVSISQVEAETFANPPNYNPNTDPYFPDTSYVEFTAVGDPLNQAVQFIDGTGHQAAGNTNHATFPVGRFIYGNDLGLAKTVTQVTIYGANDWLNNVIKFASGSPPTSQNFRVQNHSWIGSFGDAGNDSSVLRRYDYLIDADNITAVVGLGNGTGSGIPALLAHSYNAIAAGMSNSQHSRGTTTGAYHAGRYKPDLVAPADSTSKATAMISSAAAMLYESAGATSATRNEVMKAVLMAGATTQEFAAFIDPVTLTLNPWNRTTTRPLDDVFGAGELNVFNSYRIQTGGQHAGSTTAPTANAERYGYDYKDFKSNSSVGDVYYQFEVPTGVIADEMSLLLAWNAKVVDTNTDEFVFSPSESLQNLDLRFYDSSGSFLGALLDSSVSTVDNVEHIVLNNLGPGVYTLAVSGAASWDYGLAWRTTTHAVAPSADFNQDGAVDGADLLAWQRSAGKLVNSTRAQGDANGDGAVDAADLTVYAGQFPPAQQAAIMALARRFVSAAPEPSTFALAAAAGLAATAAWRRRHRSHSS